jgi:hypothetical protein
MEVVEEALRQVLAGYDQLVGVTCLADGADQIFANAVLDAGGTLTVIVPAAGYRAGLPRSCHPTYDTLYAQAATIVELDNDDSNPAAHMQASLAMLDVADRLIAVWDGRPTRGYGGTADVVDAAKERGPPVTVVWPDGARRE